VRAPVGLDPDLRPHLSAPARVQHHPQDTVDAEPGVPEAGVVHFCGGFLCFMTMSRNKLDSIKPYLFSFPATSMVTE
jgi:hypothetical protein